MCHLTTQPLYVVVHASHIRNTSWLTCTVILSAALFFKHKKIQNLFLFTIPTQCNQGASNPPIWQDMEILHTTGYIGNLGKKCPLCAFNATGGQITVKSILGLSLWSCNLTRIDLKCMVCPRSLKILLSQRFLTWDWHSLETTNLRLNLGSPRKEPIWIAFHLPGPHVKWFLYTHSQLLDFCTFNSFHI